MVPPPPEAFASYNAGEEWCMNKVLGEIDGKHPSKVLPYLEGLLNFLNQVRSLPGENPPYLDRMIETIDKLSTAYRADRA